jgi:type IV fimbrial biogenesis protein FimT
MAADATSRGFTLIELMVALAIGSLLVVLGLPSFNEFLRNSEIRSTTESLVNGLRVARTEAVRRNQPVTFTLISGGPGWTVDQVNAPCPAKNIQKYSKAEGGTNIAVARKTIPGVASAAVSVTFNGVGRINAAPTDASTCAAAATPNLERLDISSAIASAARTLRIVLPVDNGTQGVRVCDPALPSTDPRAC